MMNVKPRRLELDGKRPLTSLSLHAARACTQTGLVLGRYEQLQLAVSEN